MGDQRAGARRAREARLDPRRRRWLAASALLASVACATAGQVVETDPMLTHPILPVEQALIDDAQDRLLQQHDLLTAALIASGLVEPDALRAYRVKLLPALDAIVDEVRGIADDEQRGRALLHALHRRLLGQYRATSSTLVDVADQRLYNCVSATVLYNTLAERLDLIVKAVILPSHVYAVQFTGRGPIEIETTSPDGFAPDRRSRGYLDFLLERGLSRSHQSLSSPDRVPEQVAAAEIDNVTLVSLILSNRALDAVARGDVPLASALLRRGGMLAERERSLQLRAHQTALINNQALAALDHGDLERALRLIELGWGDAPGEAREVLRNNHAYIIDKLASQHAAAGRHEQALATYARGLQRDPDAVGLRHNRAVLINDWAMTLREQGQLDQAIRVLERGLALDGDARFVRSNLAALLYLRAATAISHDDCRGARADVERGARLGVQGERFAELRRRCGLGPGPTAPGRGDDPPAPAPELPVNGLDQGLW